MKFESMLVSQPQTIVTDTASAASTADGGWVIETKHDPFLLLCAAAPAAPTGFRLGTAVAVAFARNPMLVASAGIDLQAYTRGNFVLGLGTQVRQHISRRFSMPWDKPVSRMREFIAATHAIWDSWENGAPLNFIGEYYTHTLMTPAFRPDVHEYGRPPIFLGGLGPAMTSLAGEVADGFVVHRFMSRKFLTEITIPRLRQGLARRDTPLRRPFEIVFPPFYAASDDPEHLNVLIQDVRRQIAFYASTPAYSSVLDVHGWADMGKDLHHLSVRKEWDAMADLITDEMVDAFTVVSHEASLRSDLEQRYGDSVDGVILFPQPNR